ncbi:HPr kinase/phosphorylase [Rhodospirillum centenum]|uniref:HPr kinase n=1 Tax=Rhodospirillum centenum (strain ATCC 51521 / SW) TaxID=414684 RepID=B6IVB3_RHOCS|nr:HPr kinase [Rhodospirillum centenum]ACJ00237.1 HPr kinase [Rhodospirillum centenum SW]
MIRIHATCVSVSGAGVLIRGPSGAGKSDLALRLVDAGALLVADDVVELTPGDSHNDSNSNSDNTSGAGGQAARLLARAPAALAGLLEVRGVGILPVPHLDAVTLALVADLLPPGRPAERLPEPATVTLAGVALPRIALAPFEVSAVAKLRLAAAAAVARMPFLPPAFAALPADGAP